MSCDAVSRVSLAELVKRIDGINSEVAAALSLLSDRKRRNSKKADNDISVHLASYSYGSEIVRRGELVTPCARQNCDSCRALRADCDYSSIPLGIVLDQGIEVYLEQQAADAVESAEPQSIPLRMLARGEVFGVFEALHALLGEAEPKAPWSVCAGARSACILAPLGDRRVPDALGAQAGTDVDWSKNSAQWRLIAQAMAQTKWNVTVAFLGRGLFDLVRQQSEESQRLFQLILTTAWRQSAALRRASTIEASLRQWFLGGPAKDLKCEMGDMYLFATVCHLFAISRGDVPAFSPAGSASMEYGPFREFEKMLHLALKSVRRESQQGSSQPAKGGAHYPVVLQPVHLTNAGDAGFYSFRCPSLPSLRLPKIANYADLAAPVKKAVERMATYGEHMLGLDRTAYFTQAGRFDMNQSKSEVRWQEFLGHVESSTELFHATRLYTDSPFLVCGVRLVRS